MKKETIELNEIILVGITARTMNKHEMMPGMGKIGPLLSQYNANQLANKIMHRTAPGVTYSVYTDYASDEHGEYTYFVGEAVSSAEDQDLSHFKILTIPAGQYQKFTTESGQMPSIVISAWQKIWQMTAKDLDGERQYLADFEIYDEKAVDPNNALVSIYIGIK